MGSPEHPGGQPPLVSISVTAHRHEAFLARCLDGILMQDCPFAYEVLLGEDDGGDGTRAIAQRYAAAHPERIRLFLHPRSSVIRIDGRPTGRFSLLHNLAHARGRYLCHLDGDDHWTDPQRLRIMVERMEAEPALGMAFHNALNVWDDGRQEPCLAPSEAKPRFTLEELTVRNFIPTCGAIWRWNGLHAFPAAFRTAPYGDWAIHAHFALQGPIGYVDRVMGIRRVHAGSAMSQLDEQAERRGRALAYEVLHGQAGARMAPEAVRRWRHQVAKGFDAALHAGDRAHMAWFLRRAGHLPKGIIGARERLRWRAQLLFPGLFRAYVRLRGAR